MNDSIAKNNDKSSADPGDNFSVRDSAKKSHLALVTGASGFIGSHLVRKLLSAGWKVRILVRNQDDSELFHGCEQVVGSIQNQEVLNSACEGVGVVFHLAGIAHAGISDAALLNSVNVEGARNLVDACLKNGVPRFIFFSSILAANPNESAYAASKKKAEDLVLGAASESFQPTVLRPVNVYGAGMRGNIAGLINRISKGSLPPLPKLQNQIPLISVHDLVEIASRVALVKSCTSQVYTVADGQQYTPSELESAIYKALGRKKPAWHTPRVVFYAASLAAQMANSLGLWKNDLGLRTYYNLVGEGRRDSGQLERARTSTNDCEKIATELGYRPGQTFQDVLTDILSAMKP